MASGHRTKTKKDGILKHSFVLDIYWGCCCGEREWRIIRMVAGKEAAKNETVTREDDAGKEAGLLKT